MAAIDPALSNSLIDAEALYEDAPCGYLSFQPDGTIIKINRTLLLWLGYTKKEVVGQLKLSDLLSTGGKIYYQMFYFPLVKMKGAANEISFDIYKKDGAFIPALLNSSAFKHADGQLLAVNVVITDITDRKKYEHELLHAKQLADAERNKFEFVADYIPEMVWTAPADGRINYFNKRFADHFGLHDLALARHELVNRIHPEDRLNSLRRWAQAIRDSSEFEIELRLQEAGGDYRWFQLKGIPYRDGRIVTRWLGSCLDIHAHKMEIQQKDEFISIASHELKTPVTTLKATLQILDRLKNQDLPQKYHMLIDQGNRSMGKIGNLIDELLNVNRLNAGQLALDKRPVNLYLMLQSCCQHVRVDARYALHIKGDKTLVVTADEHRIDQVIVNFVNNAIKYAPDSKTIELEIGSEPGNVRVSVKDEGPGISLEKQPYLFDRYYRADHTGSQYSGLGLGLYICAEIIKKHGGDIGVQSTPGKGSTFWFTLPL